MSMAIAGPPLRGHELCQTNNALLRGAKLSSPARRFLSLGAVSCTLLVAGCARNTAQRDLNPAIPEVKVATAHVTVPKRKHLDHPRYAQPRIRQPDPALLTPQPEPNCEFKKSDLKTVDPDEWARLKVEYERQCYQDAEKEARDRLTLLQASSTCEIEPVQRPKTVTPQPAQPQ
jgi:hypothetical protein